MTRHERSFTKMQAGSVLQLRPYTVAELRSELLSLDRHLYVMLRQRRALKRQLAALLDAEPEVPAPQPNEATSSDKAA